MPPRNASSDRARAAAQPDDDRFFTCSDTWQAEAAAGRLLHNRPEQPATLRAIEQFRAVLLDPLERKFGRGGNRCPVGGAVATGRGWGGFDCPGRTGIIGATRAQGRAASAQDEWFARRSWWLTRPGVAGSVRVTRV